MSYIDDCIDVLTQELIAHKEIFNNPSLGGGKLSLSLALYYSGNALGNNDMCNEAFELFVSVYTQLEGITRNGQNDSKALVNGLGGIAFVYSIFVSDNFVARDYDIEKYFVTELVFDVELDISLKRFDLFYGIIGYSIFLLKMYDTDKGYEKYLKRAVDSLEKMSDEQGIIWSDMFMEEKQAVNLGMAHGLASQISFLAEVYEKTGYEKCIYIGNKAVLYMQRYKLVDDSINLFPYCIDLTNQKRFIGETRLAWCYGDLGLGYALLKYSKATKNNDYKVLAIELLEKASSRHLLKSFTGVRDKCFCHGSTGIAFIFNEVNKIEKGEIFLNAKEFWLDLTLKDFSNLDSFNVCGKLESKDLYVRDFGLIEGISGVLLALISIKYKGYDDWKAIFAL